MQGRRAVACPVRGIWYPSHTQKLNGTKAGKQIKNLISNSLPLLGYIMSFKWLNVVSWMYICTSTEICFISCILLITKFNKICLMSSVWIHTSLLMFQVFQLCSMLDENRCPFFQKESVHFRRRFVCKLKKTQHYKILEKEPLICCPASHQLSTSYLTGRMKDSFLKKHIIFCDLPE